MFDLETYRRYLETKWLGQDVIYEEELDSTNTHLKKMPADGIAHGTLCLADNQLKGRGQYERNWESAPGKNLTFTLCFKPTVSNRFHVLTLACAKAAAGYIAESGGVQTCIKWPNDLVAGDRKVGGLLTETVFNGNKLDRVLVGIGLNINQERFPAEIKNKASSLKLLTGNTVDREKFLAEYLSRLEYVYRYWHKNSCELLKEINQKLLGYGRWISLQVNGEEIPGKLKLVGINEQGNLTVIDEDGGIRRYSYEQVRIITG